VAATPRERDPKPSVPNHQPTPDQGSALSPQCDAVPWEPPLPGQSGLCLMFQNR
jgi:hypothetical protein